LVQIGFAGLIPERLIFRPNKSIQYIGFQPTITILVHTNIFEHYNTRLQLAHKSHGSLLLTTIFHQVFTSLNKDFRPFIGTHIIGFNIQLNTVCRLFWRRSAQPLSLLVQKPVFLTNHSAGTSKTKYNNNQVTTQKPKQQLMTRSSAIADKPCNAGL